MPNYLLRCTLPGDRVKSFSSRLVAAMVVRLVVILLFLPVPALRAADQIDYARDIKPILKERCYACHGALKQNARLRVDTVPAMLRGGKSGAIVQPGKPTESLLLERLQDADDATRMPPEGKPLTAVQIDLVKNWIAQGAIGPPDEMPEEDPRAHWAFKKPVRPALPTNTGGLNPIDRLLAGGPGVPAADKATVLRRVYIDLIGLPPTRDELHAFHKDESADAYAKVVDRLLASPQYGERWARHWMDVWRYSDWYGRRAVPDVLNSYAQIWRWRDWIVKSLNADRGYDDMVRMMMAADELAPGNREEAVATGFLVRNFFRWNYNNWMRDNVEHTGKAFLGLTFNCCHCHDHKYDPIAQEEYFRLRAVFEPLEIRHDRWPGEADPGPYPKYSYGAAYKPIASGLVRVMDEKLDAKTLFYTGGDERNITKNKPPIPPGVPKILGGTLQVEPVKLPPESWYPGLNDFVRRDEIAARQRAIAAAKTALFKALARPDDLRIANAQLTAALADLDALQARIAADDIVYRAAASAADIATQAAAFAETRQRFAVAMLDVVRKDVAQNEARKGKNAQAIATAEKALTAARASADAACRAMENPPATYTPLSPLYPKSSTGRRAAFAHWLTQRDNPLTARVAVNHIWNWHFGTPLVETTANFGRSGKKPVNQALLDWLAVELMERGWKTKELHRLIVTSRAYQAPSADREARKDIGMAAQRMEAEVVRDSLLHLAGELDPTLGGNEIPQEHAQASKRRSLYLAHHGETRAEILDLFDAANPCDAYRRSISVLPQQALALNNSDLAIRLARVTARRLAGGDDAAFIRCAFEQVLTRPPRAAEASASLAFLEQQRRLFAAELKNVDAGERARANLVQALFNHTDFVTVR